MKYFYDRKSDSLYLTLAERHKYHESVEAAPGVVLDFDDGGHLIGIDLERASRIVDTADLQLHEEPSSGDEETARLDGDNLRRQREQLGMSQVELARQLSVSPNTVARWERGELKIEHPGMLQLALASLGTTAVRAKPVQRVREEPVRSDKTSAHRTQTEAIRRGREIGHKAGAEPALRRTSGMIRESNSYGNDPHSQSRAKKK